LLIVAGLLLSLATAARAGGAEIFKANCAVCHQPDGKGIPGMYPPLADSVGNYVRNAQGRQYLVHAVSFGLSGSIAVHGTTYNGVMQAWPQLKDRQVADVLNYVLTRFNRKILPHDFKPMSAEEVKKYRAHPATLGGTHQEREALMKRLDSLSTSAGAGS
jgi:mono/diheme cytochrome c family protein